MTEQETRTGTITTNSTESGLLATFRRLASFREFVLLLVIIAFTIIMALASPIFITRLNIEAILLALSVEAPIAVGMVVLLISGGLDLSVIILKIPLALSPVLTASKDTTWPWKRPTYHSGPSFIARAVMVKSRQRNWRWSY